MSVDLAPTYLTAEVWTGLDDMPVVTSGAPPLLFIAEIARPVALQIAVTNSDDDAGLVGVRLDDPQLLQFPTLLAPGRIVRVKHNDTYVGQFVIRTTRTVDIATSEGAARVVTVSGRGLSADQWAAACVYPGGGFRQWAFAQRSLSWRGVPCGYPIVQNGALTGFIPATELVQVTQGTVVSPSWTVPTGWPTDIAALWIWSRPWDYYPPGGGLSGAGHLNGRSIFRTDVFIDPSTGPAPGMWTVWVLCDDEAKVYWDGNLLGTCEIRDGVQASKFEIRAEYGPHALCFDVRNVPTSAPGNPAGVAFVFGRTDGNGNYVPGSAAFASSRGAMVRELEHGVDVAPYPRPNPGWVVRQLFAEAQARQVVGFRSNVGSPTCTADADTDGVPWVPTVDLQCNVGDDSYRDVLTKLADGGNEWSIDPDSLRLNLWMRRGTDRTAVAGSGDQGAPSLEAGRQLLAASSVSERRRWTVALVRLDDGSWMERRPSTAARRERYLSVPYNGTDANAIVDVTYARDAADSTTPTVEIVAVAGSVPWQDYGVGDTVWGPTPGVALGGEQVPRRVASLSATQNVGRDGDLVVYAVELDSVQMQADERIERWLSALGGGSAGGSVSLGASPASNQQLLRRL